MSRRSSGHCAADARTHTHKRARARELLRLARNRPSSRAQVCAQTDSPQVRRAGLPALAKPPVRIRRRCRRRRTCCSRVRPQPHLGAITCARARVRPSVRVLPPSQRRYCAHCLIARRCTCASVCVRVCQTRTVGSTRELDLAARLSQPSLRLCRRRRRLLARNASQQVTASARQSNCIHFNSALNDTL